jgi:DNA-binding CsgD family transcriptional regulator
MFLSKEEKERRSIDLYYNQGKTTREIAEIERMSIRDISAILKDEESRRAKHKDQENKTSKEVASIKLFSEGKNTIEVTIELKLSAEEVTQFYKGYLKLKGLNKFGIIYEENKGRIPRLLKLCSEAEKEGVSIGQLVKLSELANENNPVGLSQLEKQRQWYLSELSGMEIQRREREKEIREMAAQLHRMKAEIEKYENALFLLKSEISTLKDRLEDYRESCERERIELEKLKKEKESIEKSLHLGDIAE